MVDDNDPVLVAAEQVYWCRKNGDEPSDILRELGHAPPRKMHIGWGAVFEKLIAISRGHRTAEAQRVKALDAEVGRAPCEAETRRVRRRREAIDLGVPHRRAA